MRIEIRTTNEITSVSFPSITDASLESAVFFINNGWTESAKRVIENMARENKEMAVYATGLINDLNDVVDSETENANYWRNLVESRTEQLDIMRAANEKLVKENENRKNELVTWMQIAEDKSNTIRHWQNLTEIARDESDFYRGELSRLEKAFAGISRGYGKLKRAFNAHTKKINRQINEIGALTESLNNEMAFNDQIMAENADLRNYLRMHGHEMF